MIEASAYVAASARRLHMLLGMHPDVKGAANAYVRALERTARDKRNGSGTPMADLRRELLERFHRHGCQDGKALLNALENQAARKPPSSGPRHKSGEPVPVAPPEPSEPPEKRGVRHPKPIPERHRAQFAAAFAFHMRTKTEFSDAVRAYLAARKKGGDTHPALHRLADCCGKISTAMNQRQFFNILIASMDAVPDAELQTVPRRALANVRDLVLAHLTHRENALGPARRGR